MFILGLLCSAVAIWHLWSRSKMTGSRRWVITVLLVLTGILGTLVYFIFRKQLENMKGWSWNGGGSQESDWADKIDNVMEEGRPRNEVEEEYAQLTRKALVEQASVEAKCRALEVANRKIKLLYEKDADPLWSYYRFNYAVIAGTGKSLMQAMPGSMIVESAMKEIERDCENKKIKPYSHYYKAIMEYAGLFHTGASAQVDAQLLERYDIPDFDKYEQEIKSKNM